MTPTSLRLPARPHAWNSTSRSAQPRVHPLALVRLVSPALWMLLLAASPPPAFAGGVASAPITQPASGPAPRGTALRFLGRRRRDDGTPPEHASLRAPTAVVDCPTCAPLRELDARDFMRRHKIRNDWMPLVPGMQHVFQARSNLDGAMLDHQVIFTVTDLVKVIGGVPCMVVRIEDLQAGELKEAVLAFYVQDDLGDLWFAGEYAEEYEQGVFATADASWIHGILRSHAGIQVPQAPVPGQSYQLSNSPSTHLLDCVSVLDVQAGASEAPEVCVPAGCFKEVLTVQEWAPLEGCPEILHRLYAKGVGIIQTGAPDDLQGETLVLVSARQLRPWQMIAVREAVQALDRHGPEVNESYSFTEPAHRLREYSPPGAPLGSNLGWQSARSAAYLVIGTNPMRSSTSVTYAIADAGPVELGIFDVAGRRVRSLVNRSDDAGVHEVQWDGRDDAGGSVARGVYFARLKIGRETANHTLLVIR